MKSQVYFKYKKRTENRATITFRSTGTSRNCKNQETHYSLNYYKVFFNYIYLTILALSCSISVISVYSGLLLSWSIQVHLDVSLCILVHLGLSRSRLSQFFSFPVPPIWNSRFPVRMQYSRVNIVSLSNLRGSEKMYLS